jgi:uncharacterized protein (TIGR03067 family)
VIFKKQLEAGLDHDDGVKIKFAIATVALAGFWAGCGTAIPIQAMKDNRALFGTWNCVSAVVDGRSLPEETTKLLRLTITDQVYKTEKGKEVLFESSYRTDWSKNPAEINMVGTEGELTGKEAQGIFLPQENRLEMCYTMPGLPRPTKFESSSGSKAFLIVWKRREEGATANERK